MLRGMKLTLAALAALLALPIGASAATKNGVESKTYRYGPVKIAPGQNDIRISGNDLPRPKRDGYIVGFKPDLTYMNGEVPGVDVIHLHHGVWLSAGTCSTGGLGRLGGIFGAAGEEKTIMRLPKGYGCPYSGEKDKWTLNYMIHNLTPRPTRIWITYKLDFIPKGAKAARGIKDAYPVWLDVVGGIYPVFDVLKGKGTKGRYTYPQDSGRPMDDMWRAREDGTLLWTAGHLHPGGLHTDLYAKRGTRRNRIFRSEAKYFEPAGAVSWDVSMTATRPDWLVKVKEGDKLQLSTTYDSKRASWYESMGINVLFWAPGDKTKGTDAMSRRVKVKGKLTHGHLPENDNHGGEESGLPNPLKFKDGPRVGDVAVPIANFLYGQGDLTNSGRKARPPVVKAGQSLTFANRDEDRYQKSHGIPVWHTITSCKAPCNRATGIAYPLADGPVQFDSGQLGKRGFVVGGNPPVAGRLTWETPKNLKAGTYTYFCRVHPYMRGAFRVKN